MKVWRPRFGDLSCRIGRGQRHVPAQVTHTSFLSLHSWSTTSQCSQLASLHRMVGAGSHVVFPELLVFLEVVLGGSLEVGGGIR